MFYLDGDADGSSDGKEEGISDGENVLSNKGGFIR